MFRTKTATRGPTHEPSAGLAAAEQAVRDSEEHLRETQEAYWKTVAEEMKTHGLTNAQMAEHTPHSYEYVRKRTKPYGVPPKRRGEGRGSTYEPSAALQAAERTVTEAEQRVGTVRQVYREAIAEEMKAHGLTVEEMAACTPYSREQVRVIAREHGVPPKKGSHGQPQE